jgi:hypothetical protein
MHDCGEENPYGSLAMLDGMGFSILGLYGARMFVNLVVCNNLGTGLISM